jgi:hypothetical protein
VDLQKRSKLTHGPGRLVHRSLHQQCACLLQREGGPAD